MAEKQIRIRVAEKIASLESINFELVGGNNDYEVVFDFDGEWADYRAKTAVFVFGDKSVEKPFDGNVCEGIAVDNASFMLIGVYTGDIKTSTPALVGNIKLSISDVSNGHEEPEADVYNELMHLLNLYLNAVQGAPLGGKTGQVLKKNSDNDYDYSWQDDAMRDLSGYYTKQEADAQFTTENEVNAQIDEAFRTKNAIADMQYSPFSANPQSGVAVAQAAEGAKNDATNSSNAYTDEKVRELLKDYPPEDGFSPIVSVETLENGHKVTITDKNGDKTFNVEDGRQGIDGFSPTIETYPIENGYKLVINNKEGGAQTLYLFNGEKGEAGTGFTISKTYSSIYDMNVGFYVDDVPLNGFVLIENGNVEDPDNAKLFVKRELQYEFLTDLSGSQGIKGESVTITSVTESTEDGGINVVQFSDGKRLLVQNGRKGDAPNVSVVSTTNGYFVTIGDNSFEVKNGEDAKITEETIQEIVSRIPNEVFVGEGDMPQDADIQIIFDDSAPKPSLIDYVKASLNKETWTFTLEDGTTLSKVVYVE